jgi:hypothetical protein
MRGCRLVAGVAFRPGSIVRLELRVPNEDLPIIVQAGVIRNVGPSDSEIEFLRLQHLERERLRVLVKNLLAARAAEPDGEKTASA